MPISAEQLALSRTLRKNGVFEDATAHRIRRKENIILLLACGDGAHILDVVEFQNTLWEQIDNDNPPVIQTVTPNGGVAVLDPLWPLHKRLPGGLENVWYYTLSGMILKGARMIVGQPHFPCGQARLSDVEPVDLLTASVRGKLHFKHKLKHEPNFLTWVLDIMNDKGKLANDRYEFAKTLPQDHNFGLYPHVDYNGSGKGEDAGKRTYFMSAEKFLRFVGNKPIEF